MKIRRLFFQVLFMAVFLFPGSSPAQMKDTIRYSLEQKPKIFFSINTYYAFIGNYMANFTGLRLGLNYNNRVRFAIGYYFLDAGSVVNDITVNDAGVSRSTTGDLSFRFATLSAEYTFYTQYPWQFAVIPFQLGIGSAKYDYIQLNPRHRVSTPSSAVYLYQPDLNGQYNVLNWFGIAASVGYRQVLHSSKNIRENLNSPTFSLGLKLFVDELYKMAFPNGLKR